MAANYRGPIFNIFIAGVIFPLTILLIASFSIGFSDLVDLGLQVLSEVVWIALAALCFFLLVNWAIWFNQHGKRADLVPARFNRQRREVCFVTGEPEEPLIIEWEKLEAWVIEAQGVMEYGVQRQYGLGIGGASSKQPEDFVKIEFSTPGLRLAICNWEAIRAYMEYEIDHLSEYEDSDGSHNPETPWDGLHVFYREKALVTERYARSEISMLYLWGWYLYHVVTLWIVPYRLVEWEVMKIKAIPSENIPEMMKKWSSEIPENERAKPSESLVRQSIRVRELHEKDKGRSIFEIFREVSDESPRHTGI